MLRGIDSKRREIEKKRRQMSRVQGIVIGAAAGYFAGKYLAPKIKEACSSMTITEEFSNIKDKTNDFIFQMKAGQTDFYDESLFEDEFDIDSKEEEMPSVTVTEEEVISVVGDEVIIETLKATVIEDEIIDEVEDLDDLKVSVEDTEEY